MRPVAILWRAQAHDDFVALQCDAGIFRCDEDRGFARFGDLDLGEDHGRALLAEIDLAGDEIGLAGHAEAVALDDGDVAGVDEFVDLLRELAAVLGIEAPVAGDGVGRSRHVATTVEMGQ